MLDNIGNIDFQEKKNQIFSHLKYGLIILVIIPIYLIASYYIRTYKEVESDLVKLAKKYVKDNNINVISESYIPLGTLGELEGAELCSNASGVIVSRDRNKYKYQAYLKCLDYETEIISNSEKYIILSGDTVTLLNRGEIYEEKGYYTESGAEVEINGEVDNKPGVYTINYKVFVNGKEKQILTRKVIITDFDKASTNSGATSSDLPTLTLYGNTTMILEKGEKYVEPGYKAVDYKDGKISRKVIRTDKVNTNNMVKKVGIYELVYSISNSKNKVVTKKRIVKVVNKKSDIVIDSSIKKQTNGFVIYLKITGSEYTQTVLPDGSISNDISIAYKISQNGNYQFAVYDVYGNVTVRAVDVNDVDITPPTVSCIATISPTSTNVYITATDKSGIKGYNFIIDGKNYSPDVLMKTSSYSLNTTSKEASAQVQDTYGNISPTVACRINNVASRGTITNGIMNIPLILQTNYTTPIKWGNGQTTTVRGYGCGPTSVSMIVAYLTGNVQQNPQIIFEWLNSLNYFHGHGFGKPALTKAAAKYGVSCEWVNLDESSMKRTLLSGKPIIAFMGKGTFTTGGHYIVLKGVTQDGKIAVNDPFSESRSKKTWDAKLIIREKAVSSAFGICY